MSGKDTHEMAVIRADVEAMLERHPNARQRAIYIGATGCIALDVWREVVIRDLARQVVAGCVRLDQVRRALRRLSRVERLHLPSLAEILEITRAQRP